MALRPFHGEGLYRDSDFDFGGRVSLGYQFDDCLFARLTYFGHGGDATADVSGTALNIDTDASYWDLVIGQIFHPSEKLAVAASVGFRQASFDEDLSFDDGFIKSDYDGFGIVVGLDVTRKLNGPWSFYFTAKQSLVFGQNDVSSTELSDTGFGDNTVVSITELGGGIQYDFAMGDIDANIRAGVEGQYWADPSFSLGSSLGASRTSYGLAGFVLGANFRF